MRCPGQDTRYWKYDSIYDVKCPHCGYKVEFFKDDTSKRCPSCKNKVLNPKMNFGCAAYCQFAEQCLGSLPEEFVNNSDDLLKSRVALEMKKYFEKDFKRIGHAVKVARYAEQIAKQEGGHLGVVLCAAYLHDIGIKNSEIKYNSNAAKYQEIEGPPVAREILKKLKAKEPLIDEVCEIIAHHHHPKDEETLNFKCLYDADLIVNFEEAYKDKELDKPAILKKTEKVFFTEAGKNISKNLFKV